jgi:hypothetical protein
MDSLKFRIDMSTMRPTPGSICPNPSKNPQLSLTYRYLAPVSSETFQTNLNAKHQTSQKSK